VRWALVRSYIYIYICIHTYKKDKGLVADCTLREGGGGVGGGGWGGGAGGGGGGGFSLSINFWSEHRDDSSHTRWHAHSSSRAQAQAQVMRQPVSRSLSHVCSCLCSYVCSYVMRQPVSRSLSHVCSYVCPCVCSYGAGATVATTTASASPSKACADETRLVRGPVHDESPPQVSELLVYFSLVIS
jgi:hypothetical protein